MYAVSERCARKNNKTRNTIRNTSEQITRDKPIHKLEMDMAPRAGLERTGNNKLQRGKKKQVRKSNDTVEFQIRYSTNHTIPGRSV